MTGDGGQKAEGEYGIWGVCLVDSDSKNLLFENGVAIKILTKISFSLISACSVLLFIPS